MLENVNASGHPAEPAEALIVLVVGTDDWAIDQSAAILEASGSTAVRCHQSGEQAFPCNALIPGRTCPLALELDAVLTVRSRPVPAATPGEVGVICALREGVPLVVAGMSDHNPFAAYTTSSVDRDGDIPTACAAAVG
jgi:hypothetical protein